MTRLLILAIISFYVVAGTITKMFTVKIFKCVNKSIQKLMQGPLSTYLHRSRAFLNKH